MRLFSRLLLAFAIFTTSPLFAADTIVTFEELPLAPSSFYNGNLGPAVTTYNGSFTSQGATFSNTFTRQMFGSFAYESWDGWSYSNMTDATTPGFGNQYSAFPGAGSGGSQKYGVSFDGFGNGVTIPTGQSFKTIDITNTTYAALSMLLGDSFAKKFGGVNGNDPDYLKLTITGRSGGVAGTAVGAVDVYLADYRSGNNALDYVLDEWTTIDLTSLAGADAITFSYESTDNGMFGANTPLYFAADNLVYGTENVAAVPEPSSIAGAVLCAIGVAVWLRRRRRA